MNRHICRYNLIRPVRPLRSIAPSCPMKNPKELEALLCRHAADFDDSTYPGDVYLDMLERVRLASIAAEIADVLAVSLAWKGAPCFPCKK
ncbi:hypothetical protein [Cupriavidus sp. CuC1]|uniref:hypothetical protein n=1 Tax=Cupriavidus sp. CuC1 TaxID=3373131 RepID=UPI0037CE7D1B